MIKNYTTSFQPFALRVTSVLTSNNAFNSEKFNIYDQLI